MRSLMIWRKGPPLWLLDEDIQNFLVILKSYPTGRAARPPPAWGSKQDLFVPANLGSWVQLPGAHGVCDNEPNYEGGDCHMPLWSRQSLMPGIPVVWSRWCWKMNVRFASGVLGTLASIMAQLSIHFRVPSFCPSFLSGRSGDCH